MSQFRFRDDMPLGEARDALRPLVEEGATCPCCKQFAKIYPRPIHATMARELIRCYKAAGRDWFHLPSVAENKGGDLAKCRFWGLIEEEVELRREDGGRAGYWRVTEAGEAWLLGHTTVQKTARVYDNRCLGVSGPQISIRDALGKKFDYAELMGTPVTPGPSEQDSLLTDTAPFQPAQSTRSAYDPEFA